MLIYLSMIIPVITAIVLYFCWERKMLWWEFLIPAIVSFLICFIAKALVEYSQTSDTEYWTGYIVSAEYFEPWDEEVPCRHPKYKTVTVYRNGKPQTEQVFDGYQHAYDVDYHPAYWQVIDNNKSVVGISKDKFKFLVGKFNNKQFVNMHRNYHSINGNKYVSNWDLRDETCEICTTSHKYENRIVASNSVFKFPQPDSKDGLYDYPPITDYYHTPFILGNVSNIALAEKKLALWNAKNGKDKQCRLLFLVYQNQSIDIALNQENYWQGGNKNEFIVAIGINDSQEVQWCHVISWTEQETLKAEVKNYMIQGKLDLPTAVDWVGTAVKDKFVRKSFSDFNYLTVEPPTWTIIFVFLLNVAINIGLSIWFVNNEACP